MEIIGGKINEVSALRILNNNLNLLLKENNDLLKSLNSNINLLLNENIKTNNLLNLLLTKEDKINDSKDNLINELSDNLKNESTNDLIDKYFTK